MKMKFDTVGGYVQYEDGVITGFGGRIEKVIIPDDITITSIAKKAFFGAKNLSEVILPNTVKTIGEWAFASCSSLTKFRVDGRPEFSQGCFLNDDSLEYILVEDGEDFKELLSTVTNKLEAEYLLSLEDVGSKEWYNNYDNRLKDVLLEDDGIGYEKHVLCGEEDLLFDINVYIRQNQQKKAYLAYLRLIHDKNLSDDMKEFIADYLSNRTIGNENDAGFKVLIDNASNDRFVDTFLELNMLHDDNFELAIAAIGPREAALKARLIKYHDEESGSVGFLDNLFL